MAYEFRFPDIGEGLTEGEIVEWKVKVGDFVKDHQTILEVETDKAVAEVPSPKAGYIISIKGGPGDIINVGEVIAVIGEKEELKEKPSPQPPVREEKGPEKKEPSIAAEKPVKGPVKEPEKELVKGTREERTFSCGEEARGGAGEAGQDGAAGRVFGASRVGWGRGRTGRGAGRRRTGRGCT